VARTDRKINTDFWRGNLRKETTLDLGVDGRKIFKMYVKETGRESMDWANLALDRVQ
jgi:hypothetical protein